MFSKGKMFNIGIQFEELQSAVVVRTNIVVLLRKTGNFNEYSYTCLGHSCTERNAERRVHYKCKTGDTICKIMKHDAIRTNNVLIMGTLQQQNRSQNSQTNHLYIHIFYSRCFINFFLQVFQQTHPAATYRKCITVSGLQIKRSRSQQIDVVHLSVLQTQTTQTRP